jgi:hypothetical protein
MTSIAGVVALDGVKLHLMPPERRCIFGIEQFVPQSGVSLPGGGRL